MSCYICRVRGNETAWTGPIRSEKQAHKEAAAWNDHAAFTSPWTASVEESSSSVKAEVRAWERSKR